MANLMANNAKFKGPRVATASCASIRHNMTYLSAVYIQPTTTGSHPIVADWSTFLENSENPMIHFVKNQN